MMALCRRFEATIKRNYEANPGKGEGIFIGTHDYPRKKDKTSCTNEVGMPHAHIMKPKLYNCN